MHGSSGVHREKGGDTWLSIIMYDVANDEMMMEIQENVWECEYG